MSLLYPCLKYYTKGSCLSMTSAISDLTSFMLEGYNGSAQPYSTTPFFFHILLLLHATMKAEDADANNLKTEKKYQKTAKVGEGTYAVVYRGKKTFFHQDRHRCSSFLVRNTIGYKSSGCHQEDQDGSVQGWT